MPTLPHPRIRPSRHVHNALAFGWLDLSNFFPFVFWAVHDILDRYLVTRLMYTNFFHAYGQCSL
jgi:hypothetical protein